MAETTSSPKRPEDSRRARINDMIGQGIGAEMADGETKNVRFDNLDKEDLTETQKHLTKGYSEESMIRIQTVFEKDRPATYGDEGGGEIEKNRELHHMSRDKITKIKMKAACAGLVFSLLLKGLIMILIFLPLLILVKRLNSMSDEECAKDEFCSRLRWRLVINNLICPSPHLLVKAGILHESVVKPWGVWWNLEGSDKCYWLDSGSKLINEHLSKKSQRMTWFEADDSCRMLHPRAKLLTLNDPKAFRAVNQHLLMLYRLLTRKAQSDQNLTFSNELDFWIGARRCKRDKHRYDFSKYGVEHLDICDFSVNGNEAKNGTPGTYGACKDDLIGKMYNLWGMEKYLSPKLMEVLKKEGVTKIVRDLAIEENVASISYTEFESWWAAKYRERERLKTFTTANTESVRFFVECRYDTTPINVTTSEEQNFMVDSLFQSFCIYLAPTLKDIKLLPEFYHLMSGNKVNEKDRQKILRTPLKEFTAYSSPCDWKMHYICELDCDSKHHKDCITTDYSMTWRNILDLKSL